MMMNGSGEPSRTGYGGEVTIMTFRASRVLRIFVLVTLSWVWLASCSHSSAVSERSTILESSQLSRTLKQCSRNTPKGVEGPAEISIEVARRIDSDLESKEPPSVIAAVIPSPGRYYRQYIGVRMQGRDYVYINAFASTVPPSLRWRTLASVACDGGRDYWGVRYDPSTGIYDQMAVNNVF